MRIRQWRAPHNQGDDGKDEQRGNRVRMDIDRFVVHRERRLKERDWTVLSEWDESTVVSQLLSLLTIQRECTGCCATTPAVRGMK